MKRRQDKIDTAGGGSLGQANPFHQLDLGSLPQKAAGGEPQEEPPTAKPAAAEGGGRRLEVRRLKAGKGGKTVTEVRGFENCSSEEVTRWFKQLKSRSASGGSLKAKVIEIQGDHREAAQEYFNQLGFRAVLAGG